MTGSDDGTIALFNGSDLDGWGGFHDGQPVDAAWSVADGLLICTGEPQGYLSTDGEYQDYRLVLEWRWPEEPGNSGVLLRIAGEPQRLPSCAEAQLKNGNAGDMYGFHGFVIEGPADRLSPIRRLGGNRLARMADGERPAPDWNRYEITGQGPTITLRINGELVNEATNCTVRPGKIGLQSEGAPIQFRDIRLTPILD